MSLFYKGNCWGCCSFVALIILLNAFVMKRKSEKYVIIRLLLVATATLTMFSNSLAQVVDSASMTRPDTVPQYYNLDAIVIRDQMPKTTIKGDAMRTQVKGTVLEQTGTAMDMLQYIPNLDVSGGGISVLGRGAAEVYINGRRLYDLDELSRMLATDVLNVEVVQDPGARYSASTKAVVRLTVRKPQGEGFSFSDILTAMYEYGFTEENTFTANYRHKGLDVMVGLPFTNYHFGQRQVLTLLSKGPYGELMQVGKDSTWGVARYVRPQLQINYMFNANHSIGARYECSDNFFQHATAHLNTDVSLNDVLLENTVSDIFHDWKIRRHMLNTYYNGKIGKWSLDVNADGVWLDNSMPIVTTEVVENEGSVDTAEVENQNSSTNHLYAAKVVATRPIWGSDFSFGSEFTNNVRTDHSQSTMESVDASDSRVVENVASLFIEYGHKLGPLYLLAGLRYEYVNSKYYESDILSDDESRQYNDLFPSLTLVVPLGKKKTAPQLSLSYSRDIARPAYSELTSNVMYVNRYTFQTGNPKLRPTYTHNLTLTGVYKWVTLTAAYMRTKDAVSTVSDVYDTLNPVASRMYSVNLPAYNHGYVSLTLEPVIGIWRPQWTAMVNLQDYTCEALDGEMIKLNHPLCSVSWQNILSLPKGFLMTLTVGFASKGDQANMRINKPTVSMSFMLQRSFFKKQLDVMLGINNPFELSNSNVTLYGPREMRTNTRVPRMFYVRLTYKFNEAQSKYKGTGAGQSEKERIG